jgi:HEPN domain-containing protein
MFFHPTPKIFFVKTIVANGQSPPFKHDLFLLLEKVLLLNSEAEKLRDALAVLMPYAVEIRYPDDWYMPSEQDAAEARNAADQVLTWLQNALPEIFKDFQTGPA